MGWFTRDRWLPQRFRSSAAPASSAVAAWQPLTPAAADSAATALNRLSQPRGQVFQTISAASAASYVFGQIARRPPMPQDSVEAMGNGDRISMRASVKLSDLGGLGELGPILGIIRDRERVSLTGTLRMVSPGTAEFQIQEARIRELPLPRSMIKTLARRVARGDRQPGLDEDGVPLPIPRYVGDIRVARGKVTLYKTVQ
ncbi:MAG TPA: hypothetical protein VGP95_12305 [Gemmatimonadaceae bacterium]|nr:hypothetical protein [Gemmatimonadaceae bacterium]